MSARFDCLDAAGRALGIDEAAAALRKGELVVVPTDTVYGLAADAFDPAAVASLLAAKGRGRQAPPPALVGTAPGAAPGARRDRPCRRRARGGFRDLGRGPDRPVLARWADPGLPGQAVPGLG